MCLVGLLSFVAIPASAQTYSESSTATYTGIGGVGFFNFVDLPTIAGDIEISVLQTGDFDSTLGGEFAELFYVPFGNPAPPQSFSSRVSFGTTTTTPSCAPGTGGVWTLSPSTILHTNGNLYLQALLSQGVDPASCTTPTEITVSINVPSVDVDGDGSFEGLDCDDNDAANFPGNTEICDGGDNDCDGSANVVGELTDADNDGDPSCSDCDDDDEMVYVGAEETCDGLDNDCDGEVPLDEVDDDMDGLSECEGDCNDDEASVSPDLPEDTEVLCYDSLDNDCDGLADDADSDCAEFYTSGDDDDSASGDDDDSASGDDDDSASGDDDDSASGDDDDEDDEEDSRGGLCSCSAVDDARGGLAALLLGLVGLFGLRRRLS